MTNESERVIALEYEVAHLRLTNQELSSEIHQQWKRIDQMEKKLAHLENRLTSFEDHVDTPPANEKPPHW